jgi:hypothetical protein
LTSVTLSGDGVAPSCPKMQRLARILLRALRASPPILL